MRSPCGKGGSGVDPWTRPYSCSRSAALPVAAPRLLTAWKIGIAPKAPTTPLCVVLYVYLLTPDVLLDYFVVLDHVLADPNLLLDHRTLLDDDLLLGDRHSDLVLANLCLRGLPAPLDRHPLHADLLVSGGHPQL